jgi:hypothetical protein
MVCEHLRQKGIDAVLTGGAVVSLYTEGEYSSFDLDFVSHGEGKKLRTAMEELGFYTGKDRDFRHSETVFVVEFLNPPLAIGRKAITVWPIRATKYGSLYVLTPTQCVMDRLAAFYHWRDYQSLRQALMVAQRQSIDLNEVRDWSFQEGKLREYEDFVKQLGRTRK